jgi:hypothetical protein
LPPLAGASDKVRFKTDRVNHMISTLFSAPSEFNEENEDYEVIAVTDKGAIFKSPLHELIWMETDNGTDGPFGEMLTCADGKIW